MTRAKVIFAIAATALFGGQADAQDVRLWMHVSGNELYARCTTDRADPTYPRNDAFCRGYIYAAADFHATVSAEAGKPSCKRAGVTNTQFVDIVVKYLRDHPEERDRPGAYAIIAVMPGLVADCPR